MKPSLTRSAFLRGWAVPLPADRVLAILQLLLLILLVAHLTLFLWIELTSVLYRHQLDYGEGAMLYQAVRLAQGLPMYKDVDTPPWIFNNYTPLHALVLTPTIGLAGLAFWPGRLLSLAATLGSSVMIGLIVRRTSRS